jgi:V/A-type H+/Na+-transporting ATPase subunit K
LTVEFTMSQRQKSWFAFLLLTGVLVVGAALALIAALPAAAQGHAATAGAVSDPQVLQWAFISAAAAAGLSTLAAGYAVAVVGSAAVGALAEKPELLGRVLILVGLAEGIAIYGLIVAILILNRA